MKAAFLIPFVLLSYLTAVGQEPYVKTRYDTFEDRTVVSLFQMPLGRGAKGDLPDIYATHRSELKLTSIYTYVGRRPVAPRLTESAYVNISSDSSLGLVSPPKLILLIDGKRLKIGTEWSKGIFDKNDGKSVNLFLTYGALNEIANARSIEGRLGITEFHLVNWHQDEIKVFLKTIGLLGG